MGIPEKNKIESLLRRLGETERELEELISSRAIPVDQAVRSSRPAELELHFRRILGRLPVLVFELDPQGNSLAVNPAVTTATGFRREELIGENWWELFCPRELSRRASELQRKLRSADVSGYEITLLARSGEELVVELTTANWYGSEGVLERVVGIGIDATARRLAENQWQEGRNTLERRVAERTDALKVALEAAEQRAAEADEGRRILDALMEYIPEGIMIAAGPDVRIRRMSAYLLDCIGRPLENCQGLSLLNLQAGWILSRGDESGQTSPEELPLVRATLRGEVIRDEEWVLRREDGSQLTVLVNGGPIRDREDHFTGGVCVWRDITERKHVEVERERLLAVLDSTFSAIADGVIIFGPEAQILRINDAALELLNYTEEDCRKPFDERTKLLRLEGPDGLPVPPDLLPVKRALKGETVRGQVLVHRLPEETVWISASAAPIRHPDGSHMGAVITITDITPLRELQEQHELYLHSISHDLRVPLTVIYGHAQLLKKALDPGGGSEIKENLDALLRSAERMNIMIEDLVDAARLQGGGLALKKESIVLVDFMANFLHRSNLALDVSRIRLQIPPCLPPLRADAERLERILLNLLSNALKYSPPETQVVFEATDSGDELIMAVADRGDGITPEDQPRIFERFYRPQGKRRVDSVGLGLYITRMLVQAQGGRIWVRSRKGEGSTFFFTLPTVG